MSTVPFLDLSIGTLLHGYRNREFTPGEVFRELYRRASKPEYKTIWIHLIDYEKIECYLSFLSGKTVNELPLYGIPFALKDNIDLEGVPTTGGCPEYAYTPEQSAFAVQALMEAGAVPVGKTNLDQFATGLVGTRSPYGIPPNAFGKEYIPGGSSSGSASAVAHDLVSFSLGTDTAGSGRVPAAFNNIIGWKPTRGLISTRGVIPACRSLDCVSVFTKEIADISRIMPVIAVPDSEDAYSRSMPKNSGAPAVCRSFGVPEEGMLEFFGNLEYRELYRKAVMRMENAGYIKKTIDASPFFETAKLLYGGPWVAERYAAIEDFIESRGDTLWPVTRQIILKGKEFSAVEGFRSQYKLEELRKKARAVFDEIDMLLLPTAGTIYKIEEVRDDPVRLNTNLGYYTNFMNLLDLSAVAIPSGFTSEHLPFGVTLCAPGYTDSLLCGVGERFIHTGNEHRVKLAVCGAHMRGYPLNYQLAERRARFLSIEKTAPEYSFHKIASSPPKPGLVYRGEGGASIEVEIWSIPQGELGSFLEMIPPPLGLGKLKLESGEFVTGFLMESFAVEKSEDISWAGSWRKAMPL